jgi:hypothetical protein
LVRSLIGATTVAISLSATAGELTLDSGGSISDSRGTTLTGGTSTTGDGTVTISGGTLALGNGSGVLTTLTGGTLVFDGGTSTTGDGTVTISGGTLALGNAPTNGTILLNSGTVINGNTSNGGLTIGNLPVTGLGTITINPITIGPILPIQPIIPVGLGDFESFNEQLTFAAPTATTTTASSSATTTAPAPSATGSINGVTLTGNSTVDFVPLNTIAIFTRNLPADTYTISTTKISDGSSVTLGTLTVTAYPPPVVMPMGAAANAHPNFVIGGPIGPIFPFPLWGSIIFGTPNNPLPSGFDIFDVASVTITNSSSVAVLTSTAFPIANGSLHATSTVTAGTDAPNAKGSAQLTVTASKGKVKGILSLHANGVPASTTYTYAINGTDIGTVTSSPKGRLSVYKTTGQKKSPLTDPFGVTSITVHDGSGNSVVSASF